MNKDIDIIIKKYKPGRREELIPLLQEIQDRKWPPFRGGYCQGGSFVGLSTTKIYGLATFYDQFRFVPSGKVSIKVCNGTSCFLNGSQALLNDWEETEPGSGQTSRDGILSYEIVTCMGGCNNGPVISINGEYYPPIKPEQLPDLIRKLKYIIENE